MAEREEGIDNGRSMGFLDHLEELRWRLIKILISVFILTIASFFFSKFFLDLLIIPAKKLMPNMTLQVLKVQGMLMLRMGIALAMGIILSVPVIVYQLWRFIAPGLYEHEKKYVPWALGMVSLCFMAGVLFAYFVIIPMVLKILSSPDLGVPEVKNNFSINYYAGFVIRLLIVTGVIFQLPVIAFVLTKIGLISPLFLKKYRRYALVVILIFSAFLTPPDPVSMLLYSFPLLLLYEIGILVSKLAYASDDEDEEEDSDGKGHRYK